MLVRHVVPGVLFALIAGLTRLAAQDAAPPTSTAATPATRLLGNDDSRAINVTDGIDALLGSNEHLAGSTPRVPVAFRAAIAQAHALANAAVPPAELQRTLSALPQQDASSLRLFAFVLLTKSQPDAAFAVLVAAYDKEPDSADALSDLAGMLAGFGYANEAIAILDELDRRGAQPSPPLGITGRDVLDYTRGYALVRLGDTAAARPLLRAVVERRPELAEAARLLAITSEDEAEQRKYFLLGVWRHRDPLMVCAGVDLEGPDPDPMTAGEEVAIDVRSTIDLSKGKRGVLPTVHYPTGVPQANDLYERVDRQKEAVRDRADALSSQRPAPKKYIHTDTAIEDTWGYRMQWLATTVSYRDAKMRELDRNRRTAWHERMEAERRINSDKQDKAGAATEAYMRECLAQKYTPTFEQISEKSRPAYTEALAQLQPYINREEMAERAWFAEWHYLVTAIAAQIGDPDWHEFVRLTIEAERLRSYANILHLVVMESQMGTHPGITREAGEVSTEPKEEDVAKCDGNRGIKFGTDNLPGGGKLPFGMNMEMTCEGMSLEASVDTEIPGVSISAEIGGDNAGSFTAFVGPKAAVSAGVKNIVDYEASAKAGAYVSGNRNGVQEAGVKYVVSTSTTQGFGTSSSQMAEGHVNFIPAPDPGDGGMMPLMR